MAKDMQFWRDVDDVLGRTQGLLRQGRWIQGPMAVDRHGNEIEPEETKACRFCSMGAVEHTMYLQSRYIQVEEIETPRGLIPVASMTNYGFKVERKVNQYLDRAAFKLGYAREDHSPARPSTEEEIEHAKKTRPNFIYTDTGYWNDAAHITLQDVLKVYDKARTTLAKRHFEVTVPA